MSCGAYDPVTCNSMTSQQPLVCATSCTTDGDCVQPANHCLGGACKPWVDNGGVCGAPADCHSGFCPGNVCCATACNATACDSCAGGTCTPFVDPVEDGPACDPSIDLGTDPRGAQISAYMENAADTDDWFHFFANDLPNGCTGTITVDLTVPATVDYDVALYKWNGDCSTLTFLKASTNGIGQPEHLVWNESCTLDDSGYYLVRVIRYSGFSCSMPYTLTVTAAL
jgi:hypothetical protein